MLRYLCPIVLASIAAAGERDGAVAEAARWVGPRACASGSYRSRARPVVTEIVEAWRLELKSIDAPPVHWDGRGYVVGQDGRKPVLVAFDLRTGEELARKSLKGYIAGSGLFVWNHVVFVRTEEAQITGYRLKKKALKPVWVYRGRKVGDAWQYPHHLVVHDNEVCCLMGDRWIARLQPGSRMPAWVTELSPGGFVTDDSYSPPVIYGPFVFVASIPGASFEADAPGQPEVHGKQIHTLTLRAFRRRDGELVLKSEICQVVQGAMEPELDVTIAGDVAYVGSRWKLPTQKGTASHVMIPLVIDGEKVETRKAGLWTFYRPPAYHPRLGAVALGMHEGELEWCLYRDNRIPSLTRISIQPDLFKDKVTPTVLGDIVYFGSWAADLETSEILWRLPFEDVTYSVVAADDLILVVEGGKLLRAFRGRGRD